MTDFVDNGFEEGDFSYWDAEVDPNNILDVSNLWAHHGTYSARVYRPSSDSNYTSYVRKDFTGQTTAYFREYIKVASLVHQANKINPLSGFKKQPAGAPENKFWGILSIKCVASGKFYFGLLYSIDGTDWNYVFESTQRDVGTVYLVEIKVVRGSGTGEVRLYVNETEVITQTGLTNLTTDTSIRRVQVGNFPWEDYWDTFTVYQDCVKVSDSYIGPEGVAPVGFSWGQII